MKRDILTGTNRDKRDKRDIFQGPGTGQTGHTPLGVSRLSRHGDVSRLEQERAA